MYIAALPKMVNLRIFRPDQPPTCWSLFLAVLMEFINLLWIYSLFPLLTNGAFTLLSTGSRPNVDIRDPDQSVGLSDIYPVASCDDIYSKWSTTTRPFEP